MNGATVTAPDIATWAGLATLFLTIIGLYVKQREASAVNSRRLDVMESWQKEKSIDRKELTALDDKSTAMGNALREQFASAHREHDVRMLAMEREAKDNAKALADLRLELARIPEQLRGLEQLAGMRHDAVLHGLANQKQMIMALARKQGVLVPADPDL